MQKLAKNIKLVLVVPVYEVEMTGVYFNTAAVIDADGRYLGKIPQAPHSALPSGFWEKFYFTPGNAGYPVFQTRYARVGVYICYDRHFPEGARILGLNGAEIVYNPSPLSPASPNIFGNSSNHLTRLLTLISSRHQPRRHRASWKIGEFYGKSYFCDPRGKIVKQASRDKDELLVAD